MVEVAIEQRGGLKTRVKRYTRKVYPGMGPGIVEGGC